MNVRGRFLDWLHGFLSRGLNLKRSSSDMPWNWRIASEMQGCAARLQYNALNDMWSFRLMESVWRHLSPTLGASVILEGHVYIIGYDVFWRNESFALSCHQHLHPQTFPQLPENSHIFTAKNISSQCLKASKGVSAFILRAFFAHISSGSIIDIVVRLMSSLSLARSIRSKKDCMSVLRAHSLSARRLMASAMAACTPLPLTKLTGLIRRKRSLRVS